MSTEEPGVSAHEIPFAIYDAFTTERFTGNPAGVLLLDRPMATATMQRIATELGAPTTGFAVLGDPVAIRYFTPSREIESCGHVTLAVATALVDGRVWPRPNGKCNMLVETAAGEVAISLAASGDRTRISLGYRPRPVGDLTVARKEVEACLGGIRTDRLLPLEIFTTGLRHLIVPYRDVVDLSRLTTTQAAIADLGRRIGFETLGAFAPVEGRDSTVQLRDLCGAIGVLEEAASGTTCAALGHYLRRHGRWISRWPVTVEQGVEMGRRSLIEVSVEGSADSILARVAGHAVKTARGWLVVQ